jgi:CRISPR system Cascade subunit CasA
MTVTAYNLLNEPLIDTKPLGRLSLPGVMAALARDEIDSFPALRPHQAPLWHMFLVQLAALALFGAGKDEIPMRDEDWTERLRGLTSGYPADEPWCLVVDDWNKPAFLQPPVPKNNVWKNVAPTADALDLLITSRNHDLKQAVARGGEPGDWVFSLVSLQTGEGYGGKDNQGIARMNGGSSSRALVSLAPLRRGTARSINPRPGSWLWRNVTVLLQSRTREEGALHHGFASKDGLGLTWLAPWPEELQLQIKDLDIWFIEVCRRVRFVAPNGSLTAHKGNSKATRINAKHMNGALGDPFAPIHRTENKSLTLSERDFDYRLLTELLFSGDWIMPLAARPASFESEGESLALVCEALSRGNSKTEGFKSRILPIGGKISRALGPKREELHKLAQAQMEAIAKFDKALRNALALAAAGGDREKIKKEHYALAANARAHLDRYADEIFFERLWARFAAQDESKEALRAEETNFARLLWNKACAVFEQSLPAMPCTGIFRPRAEARARREFLRAVRREFPELFEKQDAEEVQNAA